MYPIMGGVRGLNSKIRKGGKNVVISTQVKYVKFKFSNMQQQISSMQSASC